ncbi:MAG TPA: bifunctional 5,10-methylenetetrahydrofolate dehydrogenase/5,10-methenyltetrahydrofolate cyclohydrolase [Lactobacillaceae bacterium]|jgi:methylenetetrahydrofolate dehydrogenase (NADP+)/methenyltetrahydrofolate cyclohydrolase
MTQILDGKAVAKALNETTTQRVAALAKPVTLAVLYDETNGGSELYVGMKTRAAAKVGIATRDINVEPGTTTEEVIAMVEALNADPAVTGILVQSPLPQGVNERKVFSAVAPHKDADGLTATNQGLLFADIYTDYTVAATPKGVMTLLAHYNIDLHGKRAVVIGRSQLFGRPMAALLTNANATVTLAHRHTPAADLKALVKEADIVAIGVGIPHFLTGTDFKAGATVIDVGMNVVDGKATGDVDFDSAQGIVDWITPVPGGVGPMTIATLLENTVELAEKN